MDNNNDNLATEILHHLAVQNKRLFVALIIVLIMFFTSNMAWLYVWQSYDYTSYEVDSKDGGNASLIGNNGDIFNGKSSVEEKDKENSFGSKGNGNEEAEKEEVNGN